MVNDIKRELPQGVVGPFFNDDFGDVYGNVYAFTADGLTQRQLRDYVEDVRAKVLTVPNVGKVNLIGAQDEVIFLEFSTREMAALGISQQDVVQTLQAQNAITPSGVIQAGPERISVRVTGSSRRRRACAASTCASTTASSASATSPPSAAATSTRRRRCSGSTASLPSGLPSA